MTLQAAVNLLPEHEEADPPRDERTAASPHSEVSSDLKCRVNKTLSSSLPRQVGIRRGDVFKQLRSVGDGRQASLLGGVVTNWH